MESGTCDADRRRDPTPKHSLAYATQRGYGALMGRSKSDENRDVTTKQDIGDRPCLAFGKDVAPAGNVLRLKSLCTD